MMIKTQTRPEPSLPKATFIEWLRSSIFTIYMVLATLAIGVMCVPCLLTSSGSRWVSRIWCRALLLGLRFIAGTRSHIFGIENAPSSKSFILASKHQSAWEVLALSCLFKESVMVAKRELFFIPIFGWYLWRTGCIGIKRSETKEALTHLFQQAKKAVAEGRIIVIFPEGTRSPLWNPHPTYKRGIALLYRELSVPVLPCALNSGFFWPKKSCLHRSGCIHAKILPALEPGLPLKVFLKKLEDAIETQTRLLLDQALSTTREK